MMKFMKYCFGSFLLLAGTHLVIGQEIVINEIMYHPSSENVLEEYIELYNASPTNVTLAGWQLKGGVDYAFPAGTILAPGAYLVVAAETAVFASKYPGIANVVGNWTGILSNSRDRLELEDATGRLVDRVAYADEGEWALRARGPNLSGHYGWIWFKEHDGLGRSLELINPAMPNEYGQNWQASTTIQGTPGAPNSIRNTNIAPLILDTTHFPIIPTSSDNVKITCRVLDEQAQVLTVRLHWRVDRVSPPAFTVTDMWDDGQHQDGAAGDGLYGVQLGSLGDDTVVEYYVQAQDAQGNTRTWPAAARQLDNSLAQTANALFQVENNPYTDEAPLFKLIMTQAEYNELGDIFNSTPDSDAQMNATFISQENSGLTLRYLVGVRNRGHGSRYGTPHNYRINFRSDEEYLKGVALNLNARTVQAQHLGAVLAQKAGAIGADSRAVQLRVNNGSGPGGTPQYGHYAANEVLDSHWADHHFPGDGGGNVYKVIRDIRPCNFDYRGELPGAYRNTYFKQSNESEDDWSDLIGMLRIMGENTGAAFGTAPARSVVNVEQWFTHIAVMSLFGNNESGLYTGNNDDYYLYAGIKDPRFILAYHDLDQILGFGSLGINADIFRPTCCPISGDSEGVWRAMNRFMHWEDFEPIYYSILQNLLNTVFSQAQFDPLVDQTLGHYVPSNVRDSIKNWMRDRRNYVQSVIAPNVPAATGYATISGEPRSPTFSQNATLTIGGQDIIAYRYRLNDALYSEEIPVNQALRLTNLPAPSTNTVYVLGRHATGGWQSFLTPSVSRTWIVRSGLPYVRLNEILARNDSAVAHEGTYPDIVELYNEFITPVTLDGMSLTDDPDQPAKFVFPEGITIAPRSFLVVYANDPDGTSGLHLGFNLDQDGEGLYLFDSPARGGALLDSVEFGHQLPDLSIGRISTEGLFRLNQPTPGASNVEASTGDPLAVRINEWLTAGQNPYPDDFVELYNPGPLPVNLHRFFLTDEPIGAPFQHAFREGTLIPAQGFLSFIADGRDDRPGHIGFALASELGKIALVDQWGGAVDYVAYGPQRTGVSMGRCSDGQSDLRIQALPTPGGPNTCPSTPIPPTLINIIPLSHAWRYEASGANLGTAWTQPGYDDSSWPVGQALIGFENGDIPVEPIRTLLSGMDGRVTTYYRTSFNINTTGLSAVEIRHVIDDGAVFYVNGVEVGRFNLAGGAIDANTTANTVVNAILEGPIPVPVNLLQPTGNVLAAELHQNNLNSADQLFGLRLDGVIVTNNPAESGLVINEVLANNTSILAPDGASPDWVEFHNPSDTTIDLADLSLSDDLAEPRRWVFPAGSILAGHGYLKLRFDAGQPASASNTGFGLSATGDSLYLIDAPANGGEVIDAVHFGLQIPDHSIGRLPDAGLNWGLTLPTLGEANLPAPVGDVTLVKINEWMADPSSGDDWFELFNPQDLPVALGGHYLSDQPPPFSVLPIASLSFLGGGTNAWQKFVADENINAGANHVDFRLSRSGDAIGFYLANGNQIDYVAFGSQTTGLSEGRFPDGAMAVTPFPGTDSPGESNFLPLTNVVVSEVLTHTDPPLEDAIELLNVSASAVDIGGWWVSDAKSVPRKYQIPANTVLPPGGYHVLYENRINNGDFAAIPFSLSSAKGDEVYLNSAVQGVPNGYRGSVRFGPAANGVSFGRYQTSLGIDFVTLSQRTFGVDQPATVEQFRQGTGLPNAYPLVGPVVFTEIMYHPPDILTNDNVLEEFVELHNLTDSPVPLYDPLHPTNTWRLRKGIDFEFPTGATLPARGYVLVVSFDPVNDAAAQAAFEARYGQDLMLYGPYRGKLDNGGEPLEIQRPDTPQQVPGPDFGLVPYITVERVEYLDSAPWPLGGDGDGQSLQRVDPTLYGNDPVNWIAAAPSPEPGASGVTDADADGMPDDWEVSHGLNPNQNDARADLDGDGMFNIDEFHAGTDPSDPNSLLQLKVMGIDYDLGQVTLQFRAVAERTYSVLYQDTLGGNPWQTLTNLPAQTLDRNVSVADRSLGLESQRFYQVVTPAQP